MTGGPAGARRPGDAARISGLEIRPDRRGLRDFPPVSYPAPDGRCHEIRRGDYTFEVGLDGAVRRIHSRRPDWPEPGGYLRCGLAHRWVYRSPALYGETFALTGRHYLPHVLAGDRWTGWDPWAGPALHEAIRAWDEAAALAAELAPSVSEPALAALLRRVGAHGRAGLERRARRLRRILRAPLPVLPPECARVDYAVLPVILAEGCPSECRFCRFRTGAAFRRRPLEDVRAQAEGLRDLLGPELVNFASVFLGQNDALAAGAAAVVEAAEAVREVLRPREAYHRRPRLFLFADPAAFLQLDDAALEALGALPFEGIHVNVGLESPDPETLARLGKALYPEAAAEVLRRAEAVNRAPGPLEVGLNFLVGSGLPDRHHRRLEAILTAPGRPVPKGAVYLAPLDWPPGSFRELRRTVLSLKARSAWPVFLYPVEPV